MVTMWTVERGRPLELDGPYNDPPDAEEERPPGRDVEADDPAGSKFYVGPKPVATLDPVATWQIWQKLIGAVAAALDEKRRNRP